MSSDYYHGTLIGAQYTIQEKIGEGGMGMVFRARQESMGRDVAIKMLPRLFAVLDDQSHERFDREMRIISSLQHPHILPVYDFGGHEGQPFIVMALMSDGSLADLLLNGGPMPLTDVMRFTRQIAEALDYAHGKGIIHRDLKPDNILLAGQSSGRYNAYIADFGLATSDGSSRITASGAVVGTPAYMAPDWVHMKDPPTASVDIYSLGIMVFEMLAGRPPFLSEHPMGTIMLHVSEHEPDIRAHRPELSAQTAAVLNRVLAKTPGERYPTAGAFADALADALHEPGDMVSGWQAADADHYFYPNLWGLMIMQAAEDVLGPDDYEAMMVQAGLADYLDNPPPSNLRKQFPFEHVSRLTQIIYEVYGSHGLRAIGRQAGHKSFEAGLPAQPAIAKMSRALINAAADPEWAGVQNLARFFNSVSDQTVECEETDTHYIWRIVRFPICWGLQADEPLGWLAVGVMQGAFQWANGRMPRVVETRCIAMGDEHGEILIEKD
ncbi:MAG: protein kinase [Anaerolineae bacterium]